MIPQSIQHLRTFLPSKDFSRSRDFYRTLGFDEIWISKDLAVFQTGTFSFFLQNYFVKEWAENSMMDLRVANADDFWKYLQDLKLSEKFPEVKIKEPADQPWGLREIHLIDPAGVCWHISQQIK